MDASSAQSVNILETFNTYQYIIYISALTISTSLDFRDLVPVKGSLMCIAYVQTWFRSLRRANAPTKGERSKRQLSNLFTVANSH